MDKQARIERISLMEDRFDEVTRVLAALDEAIDEYEDFKCEIDALRDYMDSGQWKEDFEAVPTWASSCVATSRPTPP